MSKRSPHRPLYELMTTRRDPGGAVDEPAPAGPIPAPAWLAAGRMVRLPVGYLLLGGAAVMLLLVGAYMFGHWRGAERQRSEFDQTLLDSQMAADPARRARDPLNESTEQPAAGGSRTALARPEEAIGHPGAGPAASGGGGGIWGPIESDPRQQGLCYMVLVTTRREGAIRLATFCRDQGVEAYVIRGNNERLRRVIVLPGLPTQSRSDPQVQRMLEDVDRVCRAWKDENPREDDLHDRYLLPPHGP